MSNIEEIREQIGSAGEEYFGIMDTVVESYSGELDTYVSMLTERLENVDSLTANELSNHALELAALIYRVGSHVEKTGVLEDISKLLKQETYNNAYMSAQQNAEETKTKLTVAQLTAMAEEGSKYQSTMNSIYSRIYKQLKFKLDSAMEILSTIKKVISQRMQETALSNMTENLGNCVDTSTFGGTYGN